MIVRPEWAYRLEMSQNPSTSRTALRVIARRAMVERGFLPDFSPAALAEAAAIKGASSESAPERSGTSGSGCGPRSTTTTRSTSTSSRWPSRLAGGVVKVLVAIADVDATVPRASAIDAHARTNTTSVYTAVEIFPMLPEKLSTDLTSLRQDAIAWRS